MTATRHFKLQNGLSDHMCTSKPRVSFRQLLQRHSICREPPGWWRQSRLRLHAQRFLFEGDRAASRPQLPFPSRRTVASGLHRAHTKFARVSREQVRKGSSIAANRLIVALSTLYARA